LITDTEADQATLDALAGAGLGIRLVRPQALPLAVRETAS
jgi:hypothetical protein